MITLYFKFSCSSITFLTKFRNLSRWMCEDELQIIQTHLVCISKQLKTKRGRKVPAVWWRVQCNVSQLFLNPAHRRNKNNFSHPADLLWSSDKNVALQTLLFLLLHWFSYYKETNKLTITVFLHWIINHLCLVTSSAQIALWNQ